MQGVSDAKDKPIRRNNQRALRRKSGKKPAIMKVTQPLPDEPTAVSEAERFSKRNIARDIARFGEMGHQFRSCGYAAVVRGGKIYFSYRAYRN